MSSATHKLSKVAERAKVYAGMLEIQLKIEQKKDEIERLKESAKVSEAKVAELDEYIANLEKGSFKKEEKK